jgi:hypothetical protein
LAYFDIKSLSEEGFPQPMWEKATFETRTMPTNRSPALTACEKSKILEQIPSPTTVNGERTHYRHNRQ